MVQGDRLRLAQREVVEAEKQLVAAKKQLDELPATEPDPAVDSTPFELSQGFDQPNPEVWKVTGDGWQFSQWCAARKTTSTREPQMVSSLSIRRREILNSAVAIPRPEVLPSNRSRFDLTNPKTTSTRISFTPVPTRADQRSKSAFHAARQDNLPARGTPGPRRLKSESNMNCDFAVS